ncbi:hypothetical protein A9Q99_20290 [Gammaproteobacteria bacterium 45_16_T64]|nr:hypothetical protein A9Q99_20290 [Gammaproteobacteria bacterium 45_16_T64]
MSTDIGKPSTIRPTTKTLSGVTRALPPIVKQVKDNSFSILNNQLSEFFISCDDLFFDLAGKAGTNKEQNDFFDTMREVRLNKKSALANFKQEFDCLFNQLTQPKREHSTSTPKTSFDGLGLVDNDVMEKNVALSSTISKARTDCQESLYHIVLRFDYLLPDIDVNETNNPLDPAQICEAFSKATDHIELTLQNRIILYKQFDRVVARQLNKIINLANELFINAGILPEIKPQSKIQQSRSPQNQQNQEPTDQGRDNDPHHAAPNSAPPSLESRATPGFTELTQLLSAYQDGGHTPPGTISRFQFDGPPIQQDQLIQNLSHAQKAQPFELSDGKNYLRSIIHQILLPAKSKEKGNSLEEPDENVINLVAMFFDFVLDDDNLPIAVQALIGRLQIPILKVALRDKSFFEVREHPARLLINRLAESSVGIASEDKEQQDVLFSLIQLIVQEIHDKYDGDISIFNQQLALLESQLETETKRTRIIEKRTSEAAAGQAKTEKARKVVNNTISARIKDSNLPSCTTDFLVQHWNRVLLSNYLRKGEQSQEWLDAVQVIDDLHWVMNRHSDPKSIQRAHRLGPNLIARIQSGIDSCNGSNEEWSVLSKELFRAIETSGEEPGETQPLARPALSQKHLESLGIVDSQEKPWQDMTALERQQAKAQALRYESLQKAESLPLNHWAIFKEPNKRSVRCKLSAKFPETDTYVFVNRFGIKVLDKTKKEIAMSIQKGQLIILESGLLFDRAMHRISSTLRRTDAT